jgi:hypothetical protein
LNIGGVDNGQLTRGESLAGDKLKHLEGVSRRSLIIFVVADQATTVIR